MKRFSCAVLAATATLVFCPAARADDEGGEKPESTNAGLFSRLDANGDGQLTAAEAGQEHRRLFDRLMRNGDKDADGQLSAEEFVAAFQESGGERRRREGGDRPDGPPREGRPGEGRGDRFRQIAERLREFDKNDDGKIELDEVPEERQEMFEMILDRFDKNDDDAIDREEIGAAMREFGAVAGQVRGFGDRRDATAGPPPVVAALDANGDGSLSSDEIEGAAEALKKLDENGDGTLSRDELMPRPAEARRGFGGNRPDGPGDPAQFVRRLMNADKDGDGKLSRDELPEFMRERFDRLDANSDGGVDETELKAAAERFRRLRPDGDRPRPDGSSGDDATAEGKAKSKAEKKAEKKAKKKGQTPNE